MREKRLVFVVSCLLITGGMVVVVGGEAIEGNESVGGVTGENEPQAVQEIHDWYDLDDVRDDLDGDYILMNDLDENTDGHDEYNNQKENYKIREDAGYEEAWDDGDTIDIPFDEDDYDSVLSVEDEDGNSIDHTVDHPTITIDEDTGERYIYVNYEDAVVGWEPIGDDDDGFSGTFDGDDYEIRDLYTDRLGTDNVGLFGYIDEGGEVRNVGAVDTDVRGFIGVGGLIGFIYEGTIENSYVTGDVSGDSHVGGLVGWNAGEGTVANSYATGDVSGEGGIGGLVGTNIGTVANSYATGDVRGGGGIGGLVGSNSGLVANSYATGVVSGGDSVGGLVGVNHDTVSNSYATGVVSGGDGIGGLVGMNIGTVSNSYAIGDVSGDELVGGLAGLNYKGTIENSYATGGVSGDEDIGGLVGLKFEGSTVENSFWDIETSGQDDSNGGTGKTTVEMKDAVTYTDTSTEGLNEPWDFVGDPNDDEGDEDIWDIDDSTNDGYPFLTWSARELAINIEGKGNTEPLEGTHTYVKGTEVTVTATPDEGWYFDGWTGDHENANREITIIIDDNKILTANFDEIREGEQVLTINVDGEGTTEPKPGDHIYDKGEEVTIKGIPEEGWYFVEWTGDHEGTEDKLTITMDEDKEVTAHFAIHEYTLTVNVEGEGTTDPEEGIHSYEKGDIVTVEATPAEDWIFVEWIGDEVGTDTTIEINMYENKSITAVFEEIQTYELTVDVEGEGTVEVEPEREEYEEGTEVILTAVPDEGWYFEEWTEDYESTEDELTIIMDSNKEITAWFEEEVKYHELEVNIDGEGTVEVEPEQDEYEAGTEVTLTAVPAEGWYFKEWSGDETSTEVEITVTMDEDKNITAHFEKLAPAEFEFSALTIEPGEPEVGEEIKINIEVTNMGGLEGEYTVEFYMNHALIDEVDVELEAGETKTVSTTYEIEEAGDYHIEAEGFTRIIDVEEVTTDGWLIAALILSIIALLVFVWMGMESDGKTVDAPEEDED